MEIKKIYFDLDGVLADFDRGVRELCGMEPVDQNNKSKGDDDRLFEAIRAVEHFYNKLEFCDGANNYTISDFKREMKGIYSPSISRDILDEAPFAYRGMDEIREAINNTVEITDILRPIYNFKAGRDD